MRTFLSAVAVLVGAQLGASPALDDQHALRDVVVGVENAAAEPVYARGIEEALTGTIAEGQRFAVLEAAQTLFQQKIKTSSSADAIAAVTAAHPKLHAALVASILREEEKFRVQLLLSNTRTGKPITSSTKEVADPRRLDSFAMAARLALAEVDAQLPFQASVLSRQGYRVVINRGMPQMRVGSQVRLFTIEKWEENPVFEETGAVVITRAEKHLSFGRVLADRRPREIAAGNKVLSGESLTSYLASATLESGEGRGPASLLTMSTSRPERGRLGLVDLEFGGSLVDYGANGSFHFGGALGAELWLTKFFFLDAGFRFASGSGSSVSGFQGAAGLRLGVGPLYPSIDLRAGYGVRRFALTGGSLTYKGILIGGALRYPFTESWGLGFHVNALVFSSISDVPDVTGINAFDVALRGYYVLTPQIDVDVKLWLENSSADVPLTVTQSQRALLAGINYYF